MPRSRQESQGVQRTKARSGIAVSKAIATVLVRRGGIEAIKKQVNTQIEKKNKT